MATIFERVQNVIVEQLDVKKEEVKPETSLVDDLDADSLDLVELITAIEEEFSGSDRKLEISDEDAERIQTVQAVVDYLKECGITD
jgi:acyl carrier protein